VKLPGDEVWLVGRYPGSAGEDPSAAAGLPPRRSKLARRLLGWIAAASWRDAGLLLLADVILLAPILLALSAWFGPLPWWAVVVVSLGSARPSRRLAERVFGIRVMPGWLPSRS
jgi:hypothetical protein